MNEELVKRLLELFDFKMICALVVVVVLIILDVKIANGPEARKREKKLAYIYENYHRVTADRLYYNRENDGKSLTYSAKYKYIAEGREYSYPWYGGFPPEQLTLYYEDNPKKVIIPEKATFASKLLGILRVILPFAAGVFVYIALGGGR